VLVAALPTRPIVVGVGLALVAAGSAVSLRLRHRPRPSLVVVLALIAGFAQAAPSPCQRETAYYCVAVLEDAQRASGRILVLDNLRHSYVDLEDHTHLEFRYVRLFGEVADANLKPGPVRALHLGGGGFTFPRWLAATRPGSASTVLELDPDIVRVAQDELGLRRGPALQVRTGDARVNIADEPAGVYDLAVGDAFSGLSVPWHLATSEMVAEVARVLRPDGVYVLNVIDRGPRRLVRAQLATLAVVFDHVALIAPPGGPSGNHVLVASDAPLVTSGIQPSEGTFMVAEELEAFVAGASVLRDDYAPVDQLITRR
jgi:SAM-dependent methyltransferase